MLIEIERLTDAGAEFEQVYTPDDLPLEDEYARLASNVRVTGRASGKRGEVRVEGSIDTAVELACDRCLAPTTFPVNVAFKVDLGLVDATEGATEATELRDTDLDFSALDGDAIDLDEIVREQILLALPTRQLCGADCKGLCPACGINLNARSCDCESKTIDPRWSALAELKNSEP